MHAGIIRGHESHFEVDVINSCSPLTGTQTLNANEVTHHLFSHTLQSGVNSITLHHFKIKSKLTKKKKKSKRVKEKTMTSFYHI